MPKQKEQKLGFLELSAGQDPTVDIVAIHGLDGHREKSWTAKDGTMWLRDLLPESLPNARILTYGYNAKTSTFADISEHTISHHAGAFVSDLVRERKSHNPERPIIFLAHSLGGIVLKRALVQCHNQNFKSDHEFRDIITSTLAVLFFGTPHSGANGVPLIKWKLRVSSIFKSTTDVVLSDLKKGSNVLEEIQALYLQASQGFDTIFFYEEQPIPIVGGLKKMIVERSSAIIPGDERAKVVPLHADHCTIVKFPKKGNENYDKIVYHLHKLLDRGQARVQTNWNQEKVYRSIAKGESGLPQSTIPARPLLPISRNYVQRPHIHDFLTTKLLPSLPVEHQPRCILHGLGGGGKTQLALSWMKAQKHRFDRIIVIDASSEQQIEADLERSIRSTGPEYCKSTWEDAVAYLSSQSGWLLFFDNADSPGLRLDKYLPKCTNGAVLMTSRNRECIAYAPDSHFQVGMLEEAEAVELLHKVANVTPSSNEMSLAIVKELGMWALAITQAGAYISKSRRLDKYLSVYRKHRDELMHKATLEGRNYEGSTYTAFDLSFQQLPPNAQELMRICAFLHHSSIPQFLFEKSTNSGFRTHIVDENCPPPSSDKTSISYLEEVFGSEWDDHLFQELVDSISRGSLMDTLADDNGEVFYNVHPLVQAYIRDSLVPDDRDRYANAAGQLLLGTMQPLNDGETNAWHRQLSTHIDNLATRIKLGPVPHTLAFLIVYYSVGNWKCCLELWKYCYSQLLEAFGQRHPSTISAMRSLSVTLWHCGEGKAAEEMQREVLKFSAEKFGARHAATIFAMNKLVLMLYSRGRLEEAEDMGRKVMTLQKEVHGARHPSTIVTMTYLAATLCGRGEFEEAEQMQREALELQREINAEQHSGTNNSLIVIMHNLAPILRVRGKVEEALEIQREVLGRQRELLGARHPDTITAMNNLALSLHAGGQLGEAEEMQREVLRLRTEILGARHSSTITAKNNLVVVLKSRGDSSSIEEMQRDVLSLRKEVLGVRHPETIQAMDNLADILSSSGHVKAAEEIWWEALELKREVFGARSPITISTMEALAKRRRLYGQLEGAEEIQRELLELKEEIHGPKHPSTVMAMINLSDTLNDRGQVEKATNLLWKALPRLPGPIVLVFRNGAPPQDDEQ